MLEECERRVFDGTYHSIDGIRYPERSPHRLNISPVVLPLRQPRATRIIDHIELHELNQAKRFPRRYYAQLVVAICARQLVQRHHNPRLDFLNVMTKARPFEILQQSLRLGIQIQPYELKLTGKSRRQRPHCILKALSLPAFAYLFRPANIERPRQYWGE